MKWFLNPNITKKSSFEDKLFVSMELLVQKYISSIVSEASKYSILYTDGTMDTIDQKFADSFTNECFPE